MHKVHLSFCGKVTFSAPLNQLDPINTHKISFRAPIAVFTSRGKIDTMKSGMGYLLVHNIPPMEEKLWEKVQNNRCVLSF